MYHILMIEDNPLVRESIVEALTRQGNRIDGVGLGEEGLKRIREKQYDIILLDLMLPDMSGEAFLKKLRQMSTIPVIVISAKSSNTDKAMNLELGADDYISKPVSVIELLARIKAIMRRLNKSEASQQEPLMFEDITLNPLNHTVLKGDTQVKLTLKEYLILELLMKHPDQVFSKKELYERVWKQRYQDSDNSINVHIRRLRTKIEDDARNPKIVVTLWSYGYRLGNN